MRAAMLLVAVGCASGGRDVTIDAANPADGPNQQRDAKRADRPPGATVDAPITATIPAGSKLFVEIDSPDGFNQYYLYMGANTQAESAPGYVLAPTCKDSTQAFITKPTNISTLSTSYPNVHLLI